MSPRLLSAFVFIDDQTVKSRCLDFLGQLHVSGGLKARLPQYELRVVDVSSAEKAVVELEQHFKNSADPAVLISDRLAETTGKFPDERSLPRSWVKEEIFDRFENQLLGTLAIMDRNTRVPDIDRVLWQNFDAQALLEVFGLVADKLAYISPPPRKIDRARLGPVVVRPIRDKAELRQYFLLRYRVYRIMGYLEPWAESAPTGMEINSGDTHALHMGAFVKDGAGEKLVGTVRVVSSVDSLDDRHERWTRSLATSDPILNTKVDLHDPLGLPVFASMDLDEKISDTLTKGETCGELSRVIVTEDFRGLGVSELLVWFAILQASERGVNQFLLECLPVHEKLYRKFGFQRMPGVTGRVIGVDKSMIAMELGGAALEQQRQQLTVSRLAKAMHDFGCLQTCHDEHCLAAGCEWYAAGRCPSR
jgi:predicted GNAT family N-acyltransferase